jgi:hypothetical protein
MTVKAIQRVVENYFQSSRIALRNKYLYEWESDLLLVEWKGKTREFEIKLTKSDYHADFEKTDKHKVLSNPWDPEICPNEFWYVVPHYMDDIVLPEYAGLMVVQEKGLSKWVKVIKKAPPIHNERFDRWKELCFKLQ